MNEVKDSKTERRGRVRKAKGVEAWEKEGGTERGEREPCRGAERQFNISLIAIQTLTYLNYFIPFVLLYFLASDRRI